MDARSLARLPQDGLTWMLQVERRDGEDVPVVAVHGELDFDAPRASGRALIEAIDEQPGRRVVVDLEGVDFIDSAGLGVLVGGLKRARSARASSCSSPPAAA